LHRILDSKSRKGDKASLIEIAVILRDNPQVFNWFCEDTQTWPVAKKENIRKCKNFFNKFISQLALDSENKSATLMFQKINNYRDRIVAHNITDENLTKNINLAYNDLFKFIGEIGKVIVNLNLYVSGTSTGDGYKTYVKNAKNDAEAFCNILIKGLT
jgi:excinuclease UvrABC nuclease subunit